MKQIQFNYKSKTYIRDVEQLSDVQLIKWFHTTSHGEYEIYDSGLQDELENAYETSIINKIMSAVVVPFI